MQRSSPQSTMDALVAGLGAGDLSAVPVTGATAAEAARVPEILAGLDGLRPSVTASSVEAVNSSRTRTNAVVEYVWTWSDQKWSYARDVNLVKVERQWQVEWAPDLLMPGLKANQLLSTRAVPAERADIVDPAGKAIVTEREVRRIGIDKTKVPAKQAEDSARKLAGVLDIDADRFAAAVKAAGSQAFVEGLVVRETDRTELTRIDDASENIEGVAFVASGLPLAPTRTFARAILGTAGPATKEIIDNSAGQIVAGQVVGLSGMQLRYDEQLRGKPGLSIRAAEPDGEPKRLHLFDPKPGKDLALSLNTELQITADKVLAEVKPSSSLVAIQPSTGRILAVASGPGAEGQSVATQSADPPGSTFKIVTALALLRGGLTPVDQVNCTNTITVDGRSFKNYNDFPNSGVGRVSLRQAFADSCNTALIAERDRASQTDLADAAAALGLNTDPDLGYPFRLGSVPRQAGATEHAATMIGQGKVTSDALGMATVVASVVKGARVTPQLLADGPADPSAPAVPLTEEEAGQLRELMRAVTTEGSGRVLNNLPGDPVLSKTGTAEFGTKQPPETSAWMVAAQGDLAVAVYVASGDSGSGTAGPIVRSFLEESQ